MTTGSSDRMSGQQPPDDQELPTDQELLVYLAELREAARIARRRAWWRLALRLVLAVVAGLISLATYSTAGQEAAQEAARTGEGSGTYVVWWGPMAYGGWLALTAVMRLWRLR